MLKNLLNSAKQRLLALYRACKMLFKLVFCGPGFSLQQHQDKNNEQSKE